MATRVTASQFIGRAGELGELEDALATAAAGTASLAFLAGESGVGKSRLLDEFLARARAGGATTLGGECIELGEDELPYAPLVAALRPLVRDGDAAIADLPEAVRAELSRLVPELGGTAPPPPEDRDESRHGPFAALLSLLERLGEEAPVVLWLDDIHWADRSTRAFLAFLAASLCDERLLAVAAYRSDELHRRHPLRPLLAELGRSRRARQIELARFDRAELAIQLGDILDAAPNPEVVDRVFARSEGNALFTEELLAAGSDGRGGLPPTLRDALLLRVERLPEAAQATLRLLAAATRADHRLLLDAGGIEEEQLSAGLREAVSAQVVIVGADDRYGFRHALLREVIYDDLLPGERAELHLALARALEARLGQSEDSALLAAAIAHHYHAAEDQPAALRAAVQAAGAAGDVGAPGASAALLDRALKLWDRVPDPEGLAGADHPTLLELAARAHDRDADEQRAISLYERALEELDASEEPQRVAAVLAELGSARWALGQAGSARGDLDRALELLPESEPTPERARILEQKVRFLLLQGRYADARDAAGEALRAADAVGMVGTKAGVLNRLGLALFFLGDEEGGGEAMRESLELAKLSGSNDQIATVYLNYADALHYAVRSEEGLRILDQAKGEIALGDRSGRWLACTQAEILFDLGRWDEAEAVLPARGSVHGGMTLLHLLLRRASLALGRGDTVAARPLIEDVWTVLAGSVEPQYIAPAGALACELERRQGDIPAARAAVDEALDRIEFCSDDATRVAEAATAGVALEADAAARARDLGDAEALATAVARAELMAARVGAAAETIDRDLERAHRAEAEADLARATGRDAADLAAAAASSWEQLGRPYPAAIQRWRQAEELAARGERAAAAPVAAAALESARRLGSSWLAEEVAGLISRARLPVEEALADPPAASATASGTEDPFGLTPRERQVLALLAEGATNREIAADLFMAEKTASVHVSRILAKLDVRSRTEAAAVAHRLSLTGPAQ